MAFLIRVLINGVALWLTSLWVKGVTIVSGDGSWPKQLLVVAVIALIFTAVNAIVKPIVKIVALPLYLLTLGLFFLVVNALMLMLTSWISGHTPYGLTVDGFGTAVLAALLISLISLVLTIVLPDGKKKQRR